MAGLLKGVKVLESAVLLTGDYLGMLLADQGAEVIKVEQPGTGDYLRHFTGMIGPANSAFHLFVNRNKKSVTIDMRAEEGQALFYRLLADADVFMTGNIADTPAKLGMDYETLRAIKPDIVYCQATGFGATGPYATIPTHGQMMDALGGVTPVEMQANGFVERADRYPNNRAGHGVAVGPPYAAYGIAAALFRRERTGQGAYIDVSCADAILASSWAGSLHVLNRDRVTGLNPRGEGRAKYQFYQARDGSYLLFCGIEPKFWRNFCNAAGRPDLIVADFSEGSVVDFGNDVGLRRELQQVFATKTRDEWVAIFREHDIAAGPVTDPTNVGDDPHMKYREMVLETVHPAAGPFTTLGDPIKVAGEAFELGLPAPALGEHTDEVLARLGLSAAEIGGLRARNVI